MFKVATPIQLPNLNGLKQNGSTNNQDEEELKIPNISSFYRSPYNGRIKCKKTPNHPSIITDTNRKELPVVSNISCDTESIELAKSDIALTGSTTFTGSTDGSDSHSDVSSSNSSGLRGILSNREKKSKKKTEKRVKFHEQLENVHEVKDISCKPFKIKPHPLSIKLKENSPFNKLSLRGTASETDIFRKRKHQYDVDRQTQSFSDIGSISIETMSPGSYSSGSLYSENSKQMKSLFKSPMRHSYQQQYPRSEAYRKKDPYNSPKQDKRCPSVAFREAVGKRPESVLSIYSPKVLHDSNGQQFVVCRLAIPNNEEYLSSYRNENILKVKQGLKPVLPEELATINTGSNNFCNRDKSSRIMRWLDSVDDVHTKEGRYAELFESVFHTHRTG